MQAMFIHQECRLGGVHMHWKYRLFGELMHWEYKSGVILHWKCKLGGVLIQWNCRLRGALIVLGKQAVWSAGVLGKQSVECWCTGKAVCVECWCTRLSGVQTKRSPVRHRMVSYGTGGWTWVSGLVLFGVCCSGLDWLHGLPVLNKGAVHLQINAWKHSQTELECVLCWTEKGSKSEVNMCQMDFVMLEDFGS